MHDERLAGAQPIVAKYHHRMVAADVLMDRDAFILPQQGPFETLPRHFLKFPEYKTLNPVEGDLKPVHGQAVHDVRKK